MSEQQPGSAPQPNSPEMAPVRHFTAADMDDLRDQQKDYYVENMMWLSPDEKQAKNAEADAAYHDMIVERLKEKGIDEDHPEYASHVTLLSKYSINNAPDSRWDVGSADEYGIRGKSMREEFQQELGRLDAQPIPDDTPETNDDNKDESADESEPDKDPLDEAREKDESLQHALKALDTLRSGLATLAAKELGTPISLRPGKYNEAREAYNKHLVYVGKLEETIRHRLTPDRTPSQKNIDVIKYILAEQTKLRDATRELFQETKTSKFIEWFNRGGRLKRIGKGVLVGAPVAVAGAVFAPAGALALAAPVIATRFTRNYARHDNERGIRTVEESFNDNNHEFIKYLEQQEATENDPLVDRSVENAVAYADTKFDADKKEQQVKRRKAVAWGLGGVALGTMVGEAAHLAGDVNWAGAKDHLPFGGNDGTHPESPDSHNGLSQHEQHVNHQNHVAHENHVNHENHINHTGGANEQGLNWSEFSANAHTANVGEGWNQTMKELGIPQKYWGETLQNAGPKLHEQGWAYFDSTNKEWRISRPGKLPVGVLKTIAASSKRSGFTLAS